MAIEKAFFRQVMGRFATGVTIVTTSSDGVLAGLTVNAFCSLSLNPPLILICVDCNSSTLPLLRASQKFVVNFLTDKQEQLSSCFATSSQERFEKFCHASYHIAATGAPVLDDVLAFIDVRIVAEYPGGDHIIFIGQVEAMGTTGEVVFANEEGKSTSTLAGYSEYAVELANDGHNGSAPEDEMEPLAYYRGQYRHLTKAYREPSIPKKNDDIEAKRVSER